MRAGTQLKQEMPLSPGLVDESMDWCVAGGEVRLSKCVSKTSAVEESALNTLAYKGKDSAKAAMCLSACHKGSGQLVNKWEDRLGQSTILWSRTFFTIGIFL